MPLFPQFDRVYPPNDPSADRYSVWILFGPKGVLVRPHQDAPMLPRGKSPVSDLIEEPVVLGRWNDVSYITGRIGDAFEPGEGWEFTDLRTLYGRITEVEWQIAGYASQVLHWRRSSGFCPICGERMGEMEAEWRRKCVGCGHERFPMVSPAVLALVHDGDRILLAHKPGWGERRSILAGFTLPGESLEECVHREVLEEAGVEITDLTYFGSQPWPFPHQLMIGFFARYVAGAIAIDAEELAGADWYEHVALPPLPPPLSLSRQMIDAWARSRAGAGTAARVT